MFLAKYFAIKFSTGHSFREAVNPVIKDLKRIVVNTTYPFRNNFHVDKTRVLQFLNFRSSLFKTFIYKNFSLYKMLYINFFRTKKTFFNFYMIWFLIFFFKTNIEGNKYFSIGLSKNFFFRKHAYNFFFNYDFNTFLEKVFSFFSLVLFKFSKKQFVYFNIVFDELFSNFNIIFFSNDYFNIDLSSVKTASFFFNKVLVYNYWFYNMHWLHNANNLNKLRGRIYPKEPLKGIIYGFKFHFRGRFSRKQRAGSYVYERGNMPLTTLSANIDYGFITVPLFNSIVSVKVWLFKNSFAKDTYVENIANKKIITLPISNKSDYFTFVKLRSNYRKGKVVDLDPENFFFSGSTALKKKDVAEDLDLDYYESQETEEQVSDKSSNDNNKSDNVLVSTDNKTVTDSTVVAEKDTEDNFFLFVKYSSVFTEIGDFFYDVNKKFYDDNINTRFDLLPKSAPFFDNSLSKPSYNKDNFNHLLISSFLKARLVISEEAFSSNISVYNKAHMSRLKFFRENFLQKFYTNYRTYVRQKMRRDYWNSFNLWKAAMEVVYLNKLRGPKYSVKVIVPKRPWSIHAHHNREKKKSFRRYCRLMKLKFENRRPLVHYNSYKYYETTTFPFEI